MEAVHEPQSKTYDNRRVVLSKQTLLDIIPEIYIAGLTKPGSLKQIIHSMKPVMGSLPSLVALPPLIRL